MSDEQQLYGLAETERQAGYSPAPLINPLREKEPELEPDSLDQRLTPLSPREAALETERQRFSGELPIVRDEPLPAEKPPIPLEMRWQGGDKHGEVMDEKFSLTPEEAGHQISSYREQIGDNLQAAEREQIRQVTDALRGLDQQQPTPERGPPQDTQTQQPVQEPNAQLEGDEVAQALKNPKVLEAVQQQIAQYEAAAAQAKQAYETASIEATRMSLAGLVANFPELAGVPAEQWGVALQTINRTNPERGAAISRHLQNTMSLMQNTARAMEAQQQQSQQQFRTAWNTYAAEEDAKFSDAARDFQVSERDAAISHLRDLGFSQQDLEQLWNGERSLNLRDHRAQLLIRDATRYRQAQAGLKKAAQHPVPPVVQRPGDPSAFASDRDISNRKLENRLNYTGHWKDAAALLNARRSGKR